MRKKKREKVVCNIYYLTVLCMIRSFKDQTIPILFGDIPCFSKHSFLFHTIFLFFKNYGNR